MVLRLDEDDTELSEINVTPFIDVMLVLLIIFMVAAPLATVDINIDLPASRGAASQRPAQPVWLTIAADRSLALGQAPTTREALAAQLDAETGGDRETRIFLRADKAVSYGEVMEVMNLLRDHAYTKIALVGLDATAAPATPAPATPAPATPASAGQ